MRQLHQHRHHLADQLPRPLIRVGRAIGEHRQFNFVHDLNPQPFRRHVDRELFRQFGQRRVGAHGGADLLGRLFERGLFLAFLFRLDFRLGWRPVALAALVRRAGLACVGQRRILPVRHRIGRIVGSWFARAGEDLRLAVLGLFQRWALALRHLHGSPVGDQRAFVIRRVAAKGLAGPGRRVTEQVVRAEIIREALSLVLGRRVQQPHQQEERHHRRHEVGVRHLPGTAVMAALHDLELLDDDRAAALLFAFARHEPSALVALGPHHDAKMLTNR